MPADIPQSNFAASAPARRPDPVQATTPPHASPQRHLDEKELRALWRFERDTNKVLQESLDEREAELDQCVEELARLEGYHAFVNDVLLSGGENDAGSANGGVSSSFAAPEIVIDDPFLLCHAAEGLVLEAVAGRRAHLYLLDTAADNNYGRVCLVSWMVDEDGQRRVMRVPVGGGQEEEEGEDQEEDSAAHALTFALQEEEPLLLGGATLIARVVDRAGLVLGLVEIMKRQASQGSQGEGEGLFTQADLAALGNVQDQLASTLLLLRLLQRRRRQQELLATAANDYNHSNSSSRTSSPLRVRASRALAPCTAAAAPSSSSVNSSTSSPVFSNGNGPTSPLREAMMRGRDAFIREEEERTAVAVAAATRQLQLQLQQQQQQQQERKGLREKYSKAKIYIRRLEKELTQKVKEQERALLARQATEGAKRLFGKVEEMDALVAELSARQEQLRQENEALATTKTQAEAAAHAASAAAADAEAKARMEIETLVKAKALAEVEWRAQVHQLEREKEAVKAKVARLKTEAKASEGEKEEMQHDLRRCHKKLEKSQRAVKQAREYQEITQAELWDLKESLQRMEAGTNELRQQLLCHEGQEEEGGRTRVL